MPSIILPRDYSQKPPLGVGVDWSNPLARNQAALWVLNEAGGLVAHDLSGNRRDATIVGNAQGWTTGLYGPAMVFAQDISDYAQVGDAVTTQTANVTLDVLVSLATTSQHGLFLKVGDASSGYGIGVGSTTADSAGNNLLGLYEGVAWLPTGVAIGTGWHHCVLVLDASGHPTFYLDGAKLSYSSSSTPNAPANNTSFGGYANGSRWPGCAIARAGVWSRALSAAEVQNLYTQPYARLQPQRRLWAVGAGGARAWSGSGSVVETPTVGSSRLFIANRTGTVTGHILVAATRTQAAQRAQNTTVSSAPQVSHLLSLLRSSTLTATTNVVARRALTMGRTATATLTPSLADLRTLVMSRIAAIIETPAPAAVRLLSLTRASSLTETPGTTASRAMTLGRLAATTLSASLTALRSATMARAAAVTETPTVTASRLLSALRAAGATISAVIGATSSLQHAGTFVYSLAVTLAPAVTSSRALVLGRIQTTAVSATMLSSRLAASLRAGSAALSPASTAARAVQALRSGSSALSPTSGTSHLLSLLRAAGSTLTATITATRTTALLRTGSSRITAIASALGSGSFSPPLVQIASWAASRARKGIEELVLAYQSIQSHLGHTQDTAANFDAGFTAFSGETDSPLPNFPDSTPGVPQIELPIDLWVAARFAPGNYELITAFATAQRLVHNLQASLATYDSLYAAFVASQENVPWPR